jgi:hypothetical protein
MNLKFKAKRVDNNEWVFGHYFEENHLGVIKGAIIYYDRLEGSDVIYEVNPNTLCIFVGLKDKNDVEIYSNDWLDDFNIVEWSPLSGASVNGDRPLYSFKNIEIIGNKFDN